MTDKAGAHRGGVEAALADFIELLGRAILAGVGASLALALLALGLASSANAQSKPGDARTGTLLFRAKAEGAFVAAPKVETDVAIHVTGIVARTRVAQTFHNPGAETAEAVYVFPLPENAAVDRLRLRVGERVIEGQVREKEAARRTYAEAKREGRKAALVEQQRPNLFTNAIAGIGPGEYVRVLIEYQQTLAFDNGEYRLRFPLAVTPRYQPAGAGIPDEPKTTEPLALASAGYAPVSDGEVEPILHPDYAPGSTNPVAIGVIIDSPAPLARVTTSYHDTWTEKESATRTVLYLQREQERADRDFELVFAPQAGADPVAALFTESRDGTDYSLLMVMPPQPTAGDPAGLGLPRETVLVIDTSGSMQGPSLAQAKEALLAGLATLSPRDRFNVVEFNSVTRPLWPDALPATDGNVRHAREWIGRLKADGGTEMAGALAFALHGRDTPGYLRQVIFVTDGAVGNEDQLFRLIAQRLGSARLFTVGIGAAPNSHFMSRAAQFGRGTFTYIGDLREVHEKMSRLFEKIASPVVRDVTVRWPGGAPVETIPPRVPDLYLGEPIVVSAAHPPLKGTLLVTGVAGNQPWSVALTPSPSGERSGVGALWARARIASLMDELRTGADEAAIRPAVLRVALDHHLVSRYTSLVAVDVTPSATGDGQRTALVQASPPRSGTAGELPQTGTAATLQVMLGVLALAAAGAVVIISRCFPQPPAAAVSAR